MNNDYDYECYENWCLSHWIFRNLDLVVFKNPKTLHYWNNMRLKPEDIVFVDKGNKNEHPFAKFKNKRIKLN